MTIDWEIAAACISAAGGLGSLAVATWIAFDEHQRRVGAEDRNSELEELYRIQIAQRAIDQLCKADTVMNSFLPTAAAGSRMTGADAIERLQRIHGNLSALQHFGKTHPLLSFALDDAIAATGQATESLRTTRTFMAHQALRNSIKQLEQFV